MEWKLYAEHKIRPAVPFMESKHPNKLGALKKALAIYLNPAWELSILFITGPNGERMEAPEIIAWCERADPRP